MNGRTGAFAIGWMVVGVGMGVVGSAAAGGELGPEALGRGAFLRELVQDLSLTNEQKVALLDLKDDLKDLRAEGRGDRAEHAETLARLVEAQDKKGMHAFVEARADEKSKNMHEVVDLVFGFVATLDETQRAIVAERLRELPERHDARREGRGPEGHGPEGRGPR